MKRMLLFGIVALGAPALSCAAAWADPGAGAQAVVHATNATMAASHPMDYSDGRRWMSGNFNPGIGFRQQPVLCHVQSTFGTEMSRTDTSGMAAPRTIEIVYVARMGSMCGMAPFYGFGFTYPVNP
jgi:hypothetical protein